MPPALPAPAPLTPAQRALWFLDRLDPGTSQYNVPYALRLTGPLDRPALRRALAQVTERHQVLRTTFPQSGTAAAPEQVVHGPGEVPMAWLDLCHLDPEQRGTAARRTLDQWAEEPFDLAAGPLLRTGLIRLDEEEHLFGLFLHHIVCDGASVRILIDELGAAYEGRTPGPPLALQYADHARRLAAAQGTDGEGTDGEGTDGDGAAAEGAEADGTAWWREQLAGAPTVLNLPTDRPRPPVRSTAGATWAGRLPADLVARLTQRAREWRTTPFVVATAAYAALLGRLTGSRDLLIGTPVDGRLSEELEPLIGFFVNTLPLRVDLSGEPTFLELARRVRSVVLGAVTHADTPFDTLVETLQVRRDPGITPLVQTVFTLDPAPAAEPRFAGLRSSLLPLIPDSAKFDLDVMVTRSTEVEGDFDLCITYSTAIWEPQTVAALAERFHGLLAAALADPDLRLHQLPLLTEQESQDSRHWNSAEPEPGADGSWVHQAVARHARTSPDAPALRFEGEEWSYARLDSAADALAAHLAEAGVGPGEIVGVLLPRGTDLPTALLGVLRTGAAYLPLDPLHPVEHLARVLDDAGAILLLTNAETADRADRPGLPSQLRLDRLDLTRPRAHVPARPVHPEDLAYTIFTSGSTGTPKGVGVPHGALANHARAMVERFALGPDDRVLQFANAAFDVAAEELYPTWTAGGCAVLLPDPLPAPEALTPCLEAGAVTVANLPASYWQRWADTLRQHGFGVPAALRLLVVGSESVDPGTLAHWCAGSAVPVVNAYGLTETTITALTHAVEPGFDGRTVPVGLPIAGVRAYVLDADLCQLPPGVPGELFVGGAGLARGYLGRPELTAERFLPDPYATRPGARMHRTGDLARRRADGAIEVLGRLDEQLKVRGYRIEPAQVEAALNDHPDVVQSAVAAVAGADGTPRLAGYVVTRSGAVPSDLRDRLVAALPGHLVPGVLTALPELPLSASGKVNRAALPAPAATAAPAAGSGRRSPGTELEHFLTEVWQQVLNLPRVGVDDNFFDLGGTSFALAAVHARLSERLGHRVPMVTLYEYPTIAALAARLGGTDPEPATADDQSQQLRAERLRAGRTRAGQRRRLAR